ncbi:MAG: hypothetical protein QOG97_3160, partial [Acidimicrobiaceae bacterium]|nr:hypothetical protein [Acidimicrobiaceae bacterium]
QSLLGIFDVARNPAKQPWPVRRPRRHLRRIGVELYCALLIANPDEVSDGVEHGSGEVDGHVTVIAPDR